MQCFDRVLRLNLLTFTINLKNIHRNKLIQILYGKPFTREFSPDSNVSGHEVPTNVLGFSFRSRHETEKIHYRIRRCVCKWQHESGYKNVSVL